jgi:hypothetical protein
MASFAQQLPALIGVVIGAAGSFGVMIVGDRTRFRREQDRTWRERRLAVYTDYARSVKRMVSVAFRVAAHAGNDPHPNPLPPEDAGGLLADSLEARDLAWEMLLLLAGSEVVESARAWFLAVTEMEKFNRGLVVDPERWRELMKQQRMARAAFYAAARHDLGLPSGHSGQWSSSDPDAGTTG